MTKISVERFKSCDGKENVAKFDENQRWIVCKEAIGPVGTQCAKDVRVEIDAPATDRTETAEP